MVSRVTSLGLERTKIEVRASLVGSRSRMLGYSAGGSLPLLRRRNAREAD